MNSLCQILLVRMFVFIFFTEDFKHFSLKFSFSITINTATNGNQWWPFTVAEERSLSIQILSQCMGGIKLCALFTGEMTVWKGLSKK